MTDRDRCAALTGWPCRRAITVGGGSICRSVRAEGYDGAAAFVKTLPDAPVRLFDAEARSLDWLAEAGGVEVPRVLGHDDTGIALDWIDIAAPSPRRAEAFGRDLALTHRAGAARYGAEWPAYAGHLPMANDAAPDWPSFLGGRRIGPLLRHAVDAGALGDPAPVERVIARLPGLVDTGEPPARLHGDLWSGNVLFTEKSAALVDPSAYGGHREADIAMLALFGAPHLDRMLAAYDEEFPLQDGWRERLGVHQLVPLLAHTIIFGGGYAGQTLEMARRYR